MSKADELGVSSSFAAAARPRSERRQMIANATGETPAGGSAEPPRTVAIAALAHNPLNPRADLGDLQETADSLLERGQVQPITVISRRAFLEAHPGQAGALGNASFVVLDGNRRLAAARLAGVDELRVDVNDSLAGTAADLLESALVANLHREDLKPLEESQTLAELVKVHGSQRQVARRIGKSHVWVGQRLALLNLRPDLKEELRSGALTVEDARKIGRLPQKAQGKAARRAKAAEVGGPRPGTADAGGRGSEAQGGGNGVTTVAAEQGLSWEDPVAIAEFLRARLSAAQCRVLAELLVGE